MQQNPSGIYLSEQEIAREQSSFITKVYAWMSLALCVTAIVALYVSKSEDLIAIIAGNPLVFWGLFIGEVLLVVWLSRGISSMSAVMATLLFLFYAAVNGLTFSLVFLIYTQESITNTFFITAGTFGIMSFYGYTTKKDLTSIGSLFGMGLIGLIIASVVNIWLQSSILYWITTYVGVLIFVGLVAYDTQKIKEMNILGNEGTEEDQKESILGALTLYLDFINLFLYMLRLFGNRRD